MKNKTSLYIGLLVILFAALFVFKWSNPIPNDATLKESGTVLGNAAGSGTDQPTQQDGQINTNVTRIVSNTSAIPDTFPKALRPIMLLSTDEITSDDGTVVQRSIVQTASQLGKVLFVEKTHPPQTTSHEIYSAEHLVAAAGDSESNEKMLFILKRKGLRTSRIEFSNFRYVHISPNNPQEIYDTLAATSKLLGSDVVIELDAAGIAGLSASDPYYSSLWHLQKISAPAAWDVTQGNASIIVAVLDTGVNTQLAEFSGRTVPGWDWANNDADPMDDHGHGTAVAGVIAANANNDSLITGVDWNCKLMPLKILDSSNFGYYSWWAAAMNYAVENGANVINLSSGGNSSSAVVTNAIDHAIQQGVIFVTISHNDGENSIRYPGSLPQSITVGATERNDHKASFSNWGDQVDLVAPGRDIYTFNESGVIGGWWGTSFSAPQVSGAAALLLSINPNLNQKTLGQILIQSADDQIGDYLDTPGFDPYYGWGRLNIASAVNLARNQGTTSKTPLYRFVRANGARFFTANPDERNNLLTNPNLSRVWTEEGISFNVVASSDVGADPVYRLFNRVTGIHFYTIHAEERDSIVANLGQYFNYEGVGFYAYKTYQPDTVEIYRFYNLLTGSHFFTANTAERDNIIATLSNAYRYEGVAFYAYP